MELQFQAHTQKRLSWVISSLHAHNFDFENKSAEECSKGVIYIKA